MSDLAPVDVVTDLPALLTGPGTAGLQVGGDAGLAGDGHAVLLQLDIWTHLAEILITSY